MRGTCHEIRLCFRNLYLPPANTSCEKVMFLQVSVCPQRRGGGQYAWLRGMHDWEGCVCGWGWGHVWSGREHVWLGTGRVVCMAGDGAHVWSGKEHVWLGTGRGVCMAGDGAHVWLGRGVHSWGLEGGMCLAGEGVPPYGLQAGGMHPTEILSCL